MVTTIRIAKEEIKARFDNANRILNLQRKRNLTQEEALDEILTSWENSNKKEADP